MKRKRRPLGWIIYRGPSAITGDPIVAVITRKTGSDMPCTTPGCPNEPWPDGDYCPACVPDTPEPEPEPEWDGVYPYCQAKDGTWYPR